MPLAGIESRFSAVQLSFRTSDVGFTSPIGHRERSSGTPSRASRTAWSSVSSGEAVEDLEDPHRARRCAGTVLGVEGNLIF